MRDGSEGKDPLVWTADAFLLPLSQDQCLRLPTVSADSTGVMENHGRPGDSDTALMAQVAMVPIGHQPTGGHVTLEAGLQLGPEKKNPRILGCH